jgi:hypothetical protein
MGRRPGGKNRQRVTFGATPEISVIDGQVVTAPASEIPLQENSHVDFREQEDLRRASERVEESVKPKEEEIPLFGQDEVDGIYTVLTFVESISASKMYGIPKEITDKAFQFDDFHRKKLTPGMIRLLNKWGPLIIRKWKDEIGFGIVFLSITHSQVSTMHALETKRKAALPQSTPKPSNVTSISEPRAEQIKLVETDMLESVGINI